MRGATFEKVRRVTTATILTKLIDHAETDERGIRSSIIAIGYWRGGWRILQEGTDPPLNMRYYLIHPDMEEIWEARLVMPDGSQN